MSTARAVLGLGSLLVASAASTLALRSALAGGGRAEGGGAAARDAGTDAPADGARGDGGCAEGEARVDRAGHCCLAGQRWQSGRCAGAPAACAPGLVPGTGDAGAGCIPRPCAPGLERASDGVHCCPPGQRFRTAEGTCAGPVARCPEGTTAQGGEACAPALVQQPGAPAGRGPVGAVWVAPGSFVMGPRGGRARYVTLAGFWIDRAEVTAAAYGRCVAAGGCPAASDPFGLARAGAPAVNVSHAMAAAYCAWAGARLPTEAEWEFAARGPDARTYPWGERAPDCAMARTLGCGDGPRPSAAPEARAGAAPCGALDMAGNVAEWTLDRFGPLAPGVFRDPTGPARGGRYAVRGGAYNTPASDARAFARAGRDAGEARYDTGFRCVRPSR